MPQVLAEREELAQTNSEERTRESVVEQTQAQEGNHGGVSACASGAHPRANRGAECDFSCAAADPTGGYRG